MDLVIYTRVSSICAAQDGESLTAQRERLTAWAATNGHTIIAHYEDAGISGATVAARPAIQDAVALACRHRGSALVVCALSRLARCTLEALQIGERLNKAGARLISLSEAVDTSTATGKLLWTLLAAVAEWERSVNNERTIEVLDSMRRRRLRISGAIPYGWALAPDNASLIPIPEEQAVLADMQRQRAEGKSYSAIAADLDARGILTKQGRSHWMPKIIRQVLQREAAIASAA